MTKAQRILEEMRTTLDKMEKEQERLKREMEYSMQRVLTLGQQIPKLIAQMKWLMEETK